MNKITLLLVGFLCMISGLQAQNLLSEDFTGTTGSTPPTGWVSNLIVGDPAVDVWRFDNPGSRTFDLPISDPAAIFDSDEYSGNFPVATGSEDVALESPAFDASAQGVYTLTFDHTFRSGAGGAYAVEVWDGTSWTSVLSGTSWPTSFPWLPQSESIDISAAAGGSSVAQIRFRWTGDFSWYWIVDNISVDFVAATPADAGVTFIELPEPDCDLPSDSLRIVIENFGTATQNIPWTVTIERNGTIITNVICLACPTIAAGASDTITIPLFPNELGTDGFYEVTGYTSLTGDGDLSNDTTVATTVNFTENTLPYTEDFDGFPSGTGPFSVGWEQSTNDQGDWTANSGGTTSSNTGPLNDNTTGSGSYLYTEATGADSADVYSILSPCIDLGGITEPALSYFYHMFDNGTGDMGRLDVFIHEGGVTTHVDSLIGAQQVNQGDPFEESVVDLDVFSGSTIRIEFRGTIGGDFRSDIAIDDINVFEQFPIDLELTELLAPSAPFSCFTANETVTVEIESEGIDTLDFAVDTAVVTLTVSGANSGVYTDTLNMGTLAPDSSIEVSFTGVDLSSLGSSDLEFVVNVSGDAEASNDTLTASLITQPRISSYPYFEDFANGEGGWVSAGINSSWAFGTPAKTVIQGAASDTNAWVTGGLGTGVYNISENSAVFSPCFDMTNAPQGAVVVMKVWWESEGGWDGTVLQTSIDSGATWQNVGAFGDPNNWYTDDDVNGLPGGQLDGWTGRNGFGSGGYVTAFQPLDPSLIGQPDVRFRVAFGSDGSNEDDGFAFDDFGIGLAPTGVLPDSAGYCLGDSIDAGNPGEVFVWSTGDSTQIIPVQNTTGMDIIDSTITVAITNSIGITLNDTVVATIFGTLPTVDNVDVTDVLCFGDSTGEIDLTLSGAAPFTFLWDNGDTTEDLTGLPAGDYVGVVTDVNGCVFTSPTLSITEPMSAVTVALDSVVDAVCPSDSGSINITVSGGTAPYAFSWSNGDSTEDVMVPIGDYVGTITDANGCVLTSPTLTVGATDSLPGLPTITQATAGPTVTFTGVADNTDSYMWDFGDGQSSMDQNPENTYSADGEYTVILTVMNQCGTSTDSVVVQMTTVNLDANVERSIQVYPNPSTGQFDLRMNELNWNEVSLKVISMEGKEIYTSDLGTVSGPFVHKVQLPAGTPVGFYILQINVDGTNVIKRLQIK